ncbi:MAG: fumarylacetoacetate hydrolase family protein [Deltaproteobacteria bacterium]|nr:fumarylacetoacetate hydrolase family protein [Deltaproteobacteria bacterium]NND29656.1 fumarylacetoacetate hydrolase family protein [Myxococcales bacterium]MBT8463879.1 fumarylacetoacetate hydrolase family protein [Deltaproteobacteria bacterium]NNK09656.1 fumarylacetoacetate hydrolase family protein [Myxococcales bacterium]NNK43340.1 fumarylacetoacetate hydrolase family protein [Myxococcales bacterium]
MATNVIRYRHAGETRWGVVEGATVKPIAGEFATTRDFMLRGVERLRSGDGLEHSGPPLSEVEVLCPITEDRQFLCQAVNYGTHMRESGLDPDASPFNIFFRKASSCLAPADSDIVKPAHVEFLDYEVEIGLVFSRDVSGPTEVRADNLHEHVGALVLLNDVSARDVQLPEMQFYKGKSYRTFGPAGPYLTLVTREDLARFDALRLELSVNGQTRQSSLASDMVHKPPATLTELSSFQNWEAGDILATGTPGGCALRAPPKPIMMLAQVMSPKRRQKLIRRAAQKNPRRLEPGDLVEASIRTDDAAIDLGVQRNRVVTMG